MRGPVFTSFLLLFSISVVSGFKIASYSYHNHYVSMRTVSNVGVMRRGMKICRPSTILRNSESELDVHEDEAEETLLRINFSYPTSSTSTDDDKGSLALAAVQKYTKSFPFAAVLPVQPLTYLPVKMPDGTPAVKVTFLRKKTAEKGSMDGGMIFSSSLVSEEDYDEDGKLDNYKKMIQLTAWRVSKGQTVSKIFSEKQVVLAFVRGLSEGRGQDILKEGGNVEIDSVFHLWMQQF
mmetsp:Transcript_9047/g.15733  ORF Transcript_9047/g.15733 Transcript_9047/m.15733 type:complete len:236 (-) Transcript_9047:441-1148(-)